MPFKLSCAQSAQSVSGSGDCVPRNEGFEHNLSVLFQKRRFCSLSVNVVRNPWIYAAMPPLWPQFPDCDYSPSIATTILRICLQCRNFDHNPPGLLDIYGTRSQCHDFGQNSRIAVLPLKLKTPFGHCGHDRRIVCAIAELWRQSRRLTRKNQMAATIWKSESKLADWDYKSQILDTTGGLRSQSSSFAFRSADTNRM